MRQEIKLCQAFKAQQRRMCSPPPTVVHMLGENLSLFFSKAAAPGSHSLSNEMPIVSAVMLGTNLLFLTPLCGERSSQLDGGGGGGMTRWRNVVLCIVGVSCDDDV